MTFQVTTAVSIKNRSSWMDITQIGRDVPTFRRNLMSSYFVRVDEGNMLLSNVSTGLLTHMVLQRIARSRNIHNTLHISKYTYIHT
jgi:hypothetical protein